MQVNLYEWMINEDGKRSPGRQIGLIKFKGDGTRGHVELFDTCNEIWDVRDVTNDFYKEKVIILDKLGKYDLASTLNSPIHITTACKCVGDVHYTKGFFYMDMSKGFPGGLGERMGGIEGIYASEFTYKTQTGHPPGMPWQRETIQYILDYRLASWFGTLCGKIVSSEK